MHLRPLESDRVVIRIIAAGSVENRRAGSWHRLRWVPPRIGNGWAIIVDHHNIDVLGVRTVAVANRELECKRNAVLLKAHCRGGEGRQIGRASCREREYRWG